MTVQWYRIKRTYDAFSVSRRWLAIGFVLLVPLHSLFHELDCLPWSARAGNLELLSTLFVVGNKKLFELRQLQLLVSILHFGEAHRVNGRPLLSRSPLVGVQIPQERNPMRPVATDERYRKLLEVADEVEPLGRFRCVLSLARECGRRINAIVNLRPTDVLLSCEQIEIALAAVGAPTEWAAHWPHGAIRWRAEFDKMGMSR